jgi:hypothetical protein
VLQDCCRQAGLSAVMGLLFSDIFSALLYSCDYIFFYYRTRELFSLEKIYPEIFLIQKEESVNICLDVSVVKKFKFIL